MKHGSNAFLNTCSYKDDFLNVFDQSRFNVNYILHIGNLSILTNAGINLQPTCFHPFINLRDHLLNGIQPDPYCVSDERFTQSIQFTIYAGQDIKYSLAGDPDIQQRSDMLQCGGVPYLSVQNMVQSDNSVISNTFATTCLLSPDNGPFSNTNVLKGINENCPPLNFLPSGAHSNTSSDYHNQQLSTQPPPSTKDENSSSYSFVIGEHILSSHVSYEVLSFLGRGTFGQVLKCHSSKHGLVALKVLKSHPAFHRQGIVEISILQLLSRENTDAFNIVRTLECFQHGNHICLAFELLQENLYEYTKANKFVPMALNDIRTIAYQVLNALTKLKQLGLIHADLKPENIMLVNYSHMAKRNSDVPFLVKVIDFGSACFTNQAVPNTYLQSRYYRSPEILLGVPFNEAIDIWSLGCICSELFLGYPIYPGLCEYDQMRYIVETQGMPLSILQHAVKYGHYFVMDAHGNHRFKMRLEYSRETGKSSTETRVFILPSLRAIEDAHLVKSRSDSPNTMAILKAGLSPSSDLKEIETYAEACDRHELADFLCHLMHLDPSKRIIPEVALEHTFINMRHLVGFSTVCPSVRDGFMMRRSLLCYYYDLTMNQPRRMDCFAWEQKTFLPPHENLISPLGDMLFNVTVSDVDQALHSAFNYMEPSQVITMGKNLHPSVQVILNQGWCVNPVMMGADALPIKASFCEPTDCANQQGKNSSSDSLLSLLQQQCSSLASSFTVDSKMNSNSDSDIWLPLIPNPIVSHDDVYPKRNFMENSISDIPTQSSHCGKVYSPANEALNTSGNNGEVMYQQSFLKVPDISTTMISGMLGLTLDFCSPSTVDNNMPSCHPPPSDNYNNCLCNDNHLQTGALFPEPAPLMQAFYSNSANQLTACSPIPPFAMNALDMLYSGINSQNTLSTNTNNLSPNGSYECNFPLSHSSFHGADTIGIIGLPLEFYSPIKSANEHNDNGLQIGTLFPQPSIPLSYSSNVFKPKSVSPLPPPILNGNSMANNDMSYQSPLSTWLSDLRMAINSACNENEFYELASHVSPYMGIDALSPCKNNNTMTSRKVYPMPGGCN